MEAGQEYSRSGLKSDENTYTILVPLQDISRSNTLLPPAIRAAKEHDGHIILLNTIEIPYQLPPSEAKQFVLEREVMLMHSLDVIKTAGCEGEIMIRIAHRLDYAIDQIALSLKADLIVMWMKNSGPFFDRTIYKKLQHLNSNILVATKNVESRFDEVIIIVDQDHKVNPMLSVALYLLGSKNRRVHVIPACHSEHEKQYCEKIMYSVESFIKECSYKQAKANVQIVNSLKEISSSVSAHTCMLLAANSWNRSKLRKKLRASVLEIDIPVFLFKCKIKKPAGTKSITAQIKKLFEY